MLPALATAVTVLAALLVAVAPRSAQADVCVLAPALRDTSVSQGIGTTTTAPGYRLLRRGKTTLVKAFLSKPQCAAPEDRVKILSATLQVSFPGSISTDVANIVTGPEYPELLAYTAAPAQNVASDPVFSVPGRLLDGTTTSQATAQFTITVQWKAQSALGLTGGVAVLRPGGALTGPTVKATFEGPSYSPRVLIVPMGDPTKGFIPNWPDRTSSTSADGADDVLLRALQAVSRMSPFKDGVTTNLLGTEGLRYAVAPTILDVRSAIRADGKFCGTGSNFSYVRGQLSSFLNNWQAENSEPVDKVLGVVWGANSTGPDTDTSCADGYASIGGNQAWSRLLPDAAAAPSRAGNLIMMETVGHNFGSVPSFRSDDRDAYHSVLTADAGTRGVNTATRETITNALSVLKYSLTGWDDYTTLLRQEDWIYTLCRLTPSSKDSCPVEQIDPSNNTTPLGAPAAPVPLVYTIAGKTDGTLAGTDFDTFLADTTDLSEPAKSSEYRLVQRAIDGSILSTTMFPVDFRTSEHHDDTTHDHPTAEVGTAEVRFAAAADAEIFEVYNGDPQTTEPIYRRVRNGAPELQAASLTAEPLVNQTEGTNGGALPALSPDRRVLAYTSPPSETASAQIVLKDLTTGARGAAFAGDAAAWVTDSRLAFVRGGNLYVGTVTDDDDGNPTVTARNTSTVYDASQQVELFFAPAGRPTADPVDTADPQADNNRHLITAINGDLWRIDLEAAVLTPDGVTCRLAAPSLAPCHRLTTDAATDSEPSYESPGRVLFNRDGDIRALDVANRVVHADGIESAQQPSASAPFVAYEREGGLGLADSTSLDVKRAVLTSGQDSAPSLVGDALAFARTDGSRTDVFTTRLPSGQGGSTLTFSAKDASPALLRAGVYATCDELGQPVFNYPIFVATPPSTVTRDVATWSLEWDGAGSSCTQPALYAIINDGIDSVRVDFGTGHGSSQPRIGLAGALYSPAPGSTILQYDTPALLGDVPGVPVADLSWRITGPNDYDQVLDFIRGEPTIAMPPDGGWEPGGTYEVQLRRGSEVRASGAFSVLEDADHDNIPRLVEDRCFPPGADTDPTNAGGDLDLDGEINVADSNPCSSSLNVNVDLDANTLNSASKGNTVTFHLSNSAVDLRSVPMSNIALTRIGGYEAHLPATAYEEVTATSATVKVSRQDLQDFVTAQGLTGYVPLVLSGTGPAGSFRGFDPTDPKFV